MDESENNRLAEALMQLASGDALGLSEIDFRLQKILFTVGRAYYKDTDDIKDAVQDLYVVLPSVANQFRENTSACAWILTVYKNIIRTQLRKKNQERGYIKNQKVNLKIQSNRSLEDVIDDRLFFIEIMSRLSEYERELLVYSMSKYTVREIAQFVNKPRSTVENHLLILKEKIRKMKY